jgi:aspartate kinase
MARIVVQKFGGSSVGDVEKIRKVAQRVKARRDEGWQLVVVVSAMGDTTDELLSLAKQISADPPRRELDMLLTCGERISMALLSMALQELGVPAISFTGSQSGIITDDTHSQARIVEVRPARIEEALAQGRVVIVAGYQGVSRSREVTTLGRGGSDTSAVALAAALQADCEIYSDVDGIFSADPRVVPSATKLESISPEEMQELASAGAKVLNAQAVEFAREHGVVIHAKSTHSAGTGTRIEATPGERGRVRGVTCGASASPVALTRSSRSSTGTRSSRAACRSTPPAARWCWCRSRTCMGPRRCARSCRRRSRCSTSWRPSPAWGWGSTVTASSFGAR